MSIDPARSHGTQVEQSRAVAEVFAAAELASRFPRNEQQAEARMLAQCARKSLAEQAEYALPRAGKEVTGPTVHLARELARIWGNITHGVVEISRNPDAGQSELMAYAWDVETNTRSARTFIVLADYRGAAAWKQQQQVTNQNNSVAARQLREVIFSVLPQSFTEDAIKACRATLAGVEEGAVLTSAAIGGQSPRKVLTERIGAAVRKFADNGVTALQLTTWAGSDPASWNADMLAKVGVLYRSLENGDITLDQAFPTTPLSADDIPEAGPSGHRKAMSDAVNRAADMLNQMEPTEAELAAAADREAGL